MRTTESPTVTPAPLPGARLAPKVTRWAWTGRWRRKADEEQGYREADPDSVGLRHNRSLTELREV